MAKAACGMKNTNSVMHECRRKQQLKLNKWVDKDMSGLFLFGLICRVFCLLHVQSRNVNLIQRVVL